MVAMAAGDGARSKIEGGGAPDAVGKVASEGVVMIEKFVEVIFVVHVKLRCPCGEGRAWKPGYPPDAVVFKKFFKLPAVICRVA